MTALVSIYTPGGFVIGADTLRRDMRGQFVTDSATKVHSTNHPQFVGAYGFAGHTQLEYADKRPPCNILDNALNVAAEMSECPVDSAQQYVDQFCADLAAHIATASAGVSLSALETGTEFLRVMFVGYYEGQAYRLQNVFEISKGVLQFPKLVELVTSPNDFCIASGSAVVWHELSQEANQPGGLREGIDFVEKYINRCIENDSDPYCADIGGHPQIATVTDKGFDWVLRP